MELGVPHPAEICAKYICFFCSGSVEVQLSENGIFFTPVKYTLVRRVPLVFWAGSVTWF